jgi:hypothetical protein
MVTNKVHGVYTVTMKRSKSQTGFIGTTTMMTAAGARCPYVSKKENQNSLLLRRGGTVAGMRIAGWDLPARHRLGLTSPKGGGIEGSNMQNNVLYYETV